MILVGSSLNSAPQRDFGWLPWTWVLHKVQHCTQHLWTGWGSLWNYHVWRDVDISQFCEFEWFEWVMFWDKTALYSDDHFSLGRSLGLNIDIGPALIAKITKENIQVPHWSKHQAPTQNEWEQEECKAEYSLFMASLIQSWISVKS